MRETLCSFAIFHVFRGLRRAAAKQDTCMCHARSCMRLDRTRCTADSGMCQYVKFYDLSKYRSTREDACLARWKEELRCC